MQWTKPETEKERIYYSKFAGVLKAYKNTRWIVQYLIWLPIAAFAITDIVIQPLRQFINIPFAPTLLLIGAATYFLHSLLASEYKTYWFDKLDTNPDTNSTIYFSLLLGAFLGFAEYSASSNYLIAQIQQPTEANPFTADSIYQLQIGELNANYDANKNRIEDNYNRQTQLAAPTLYSQWQEWEGRKAANWKDLQFIRSQRSKYQKQFYNHPKVAALMAKQGEELASLQANNDKELLLLQSNRDNQKTSITAANTAALSNYQQQVTKAKSLGGIISMFCMAVFFWTAYKEVLILVNSGIFPIQEFTDLQANGGNAQKFWAVIGDMLNRSIHARLYKAHRKHSAQVGPLYGLDGRLIMENGNYQNTPKPEGINGKKILESLGKN